MVAFVRLKVKLQSLVVNGVVFNDFSDDPAHVVFVGQLFEQVCNSIQVSVLHIVIPAYAGNRIFRLKHVSNWRVVHDDDVGHASAQACQIFYECVIEESAMLSEQLVGAETFGVELSNQGFCVLGQTGSKNNHFVVSAHALQETADARPHQNINLANLTFDFDRKNNISIFHWLELRVNESFIEIKH